MPREDVPGPGQFGPAEEHHHTMEELRCKSRLVTVIRERDQVRAQADALAEALDELDRYTLDPDYNESPCQKKVEAALRAYRSSRESSDAS